MLAERFGEPAWVTKARAFNWGASDTVNSNHGGHEMMQVALNLQESPEIGIAILRSLSHTMVEVHTREMCFAVDGLIPHSNQFQALAKGAQVQFNNTLDFPKKELTFLQAYTQTDSMSCGYHLLDLIHFILFISKDFNPSGYEAPPVSQQADN